MIRLKAGVRIHGIRSETVLAIGIVEGVYASYGYTLTVTSVLDGQHMRASLHYVGAAFDGGLPGSKVEEIADKCRGALGDDYDVVVEAEHIHFEFQPKMAYAQAINTRES